MVLPQKEIFFTKHFVYRVYLPSFYEEIERKYEDFEWLYQQLLTAHPQLYIPLLPKPLNYNKLNKEAVVKHCKEFQEFLIDIFKYQVLFSDASVTFFFNDRQKTDFEKVRNNFIYHKNDQHLSTAAHNTQNSMSFGDGDDNDNDNNDKKNIKNDEKKLNVGSPEIFHRLESENSLVE